MRTHTILAVAAVATLFSTASNAQTYRPAAKPTPSYNTSDPNMAHTSDGAGMSGNAGQRSNTGLNTIAPRRQTGQCDSQYCYTVQ